MPNKLRSQRRLQLYEGESQTQKATCRTPKGKQFLKKSDGILCERNRLEAYRFIQKYNNEFGLRWLLRKFNICPNAYYNYLKKRKVHYHEHKEKIKSAIREIYHSHGGVDGYRTMQVYLARKDIHMIMLLWKDILIH